MLWIGTERPPCAAIGILRIIITVVSMILSLFSRLSGQFRITVFYDDNTGETKDVSRMYIVSSLCRHSPLTLLYTFEPL